MKLTRELVKELKINPIGNIKIPNNITTIDSCVFSNCEYLNNVEVPDGLKIIYFNAFSDCKNLININIPESVTYIAKHAFLNCENLTSIILPNNVQIIDDEAFAGCKNLTDVYWNSFIKPTKHKLKKIFQDCPSLKSITYHGTKIELNSKNLNEEIDKATPPAPYELAESLDDIIKNANKPNI